MKHKNSFYKFSTLLGVATLLQVPTLFANDNPDDYNFTTIVSAPTNINNLSARVILNSQTNLLFYNGSQDGNHQGGFYKFNTFDNQWGQYKLPIDSENSKTTTNGIIAAVDGPYKHTLVLSYKQNNDTTTQYLSNTVNGSVWDTNKILLQKNFTNLVATNVYDEQNFMAYGENHQSILASHDGSIWGSYSAPNTCLDNPKCTFSNKHFASVYNGYLLLQSTSQTQSDEDNNNSENSDSTNSVSIDVTSFNNKLLFTQNFTTWYTVEIPFANDEVNKAFKTDKNGLIASVTSKEDGSHKLYYTKDYKKWQSFDLSKDVKVQDAKTGYKHYITLSLGHDNKSDIVVLDPQENTQHVFTSFEGAVTSMDWYNNSLYLSGSFVNFRDGAHALLANMTKKSGDENDSDKSPETDDASNSESQVKINVNNLNPLYSYNS